MSADVDSVRRFLAESSALRGQFVRLARVWTEAREHAQYPPPVRDLLGEALGATVLLASTLKFQGTLSLQLEAEGAVRLLVAQCTQDFRVRGVARFDAARVSEEFATLVGAGRIVVTVEGENPSARYQGIAPIAGGSLSATLENYFSQSEQVATCVRLAADDRHAGGMLVQRLPLAGGIEAAAGDADPDAQAEARARREREATVAWELAHASLLALDRDELLGRPAETLMRRCLGEGDLRAFPPADVRFQCRCSRERVAGILRALGEEEIRDVLAEQGSVSVTCEFCQRPYRFDAIDVEQLFGDGAPASGRVN